MRKEKNGWPALVKVGHRSSAATRGRHPQGLVERLVRNESDLEGLDAKLHIVRLSAHLGERRRLALVERARSLNVHIANPGKEGARPVSEELTGTAQTASQETDKQSEPSTSVTSQEEPES